DIAVKQEILETFDHRQRLDRITDTLTGEVEILELDQKIRSRVRRQMERNQREYYLKEQLKAITAELGQDLASEVDRLKARVAEKKLAPAIETRVLAEVLRLERTPQTSPEASVIRNYLELVLALPWNEATEDRLDINVAQQILNDDHYGLEAVK